MTSDETVLAMVLPDGGGLWRRFGDGRGSSKLFVVELGSRWFRSGDSLPPVVVKLGNGESPSSFSWTWHSVLIMFRWFNE